MVAGPKKVGVSTAVNVAAARYLPVVPVVPIAKVEVPSETLDVKIP
jgi:hypothetical protein